MENYRLCLLCGTLLGFLFFNKHPARIFLGDCGSMFIGYVLAILAVVGGYKKTTILAITVPIMIVGVPVFDTLSAMFRRVQKRVISEKKLNISMFLSMFQADRAHIHHVLLSKGYTHKFSVLILLALSLMLSVFALLASLIEDPKVSIVFVIVGICSFFLVRNMRHKREQNIGIRNPK
jgi:UDP-GlcNAc:undecaprenyl-phosphate GlcNAc-1-phosphate transferase